MTHRCVAARRLLRWLLPALALAGCDQPNYAPPTLIDRLRVIAVRAEPPWLGVGPTQLRAKAVGAPDDAVLCHAWSLCLFAWQEDGNYQCIDPELAVDLGTGATATVSVLDLLPLLPKVPTVLQRKGLLPPDELSGGDDGGGGAPGDDTPESDTGFEVQVLFQVSEAAMWGGSCPSATEALAAPCADRARCVAGFKRLKLGVDTDGAPDPRVVHENPRLLGLRVDDDSWPAGVRLQVRPYLAPAPTFDPDAPDWTGIRLEPTFDPASLEVVQKSADPGLPDVAETLVFSFFATQGRFDYTRTGDNVPHNGFQPEAVPEDADDARRRIRLWVVARDDRGGVDWLEREAELVPDGVLPDECIALLPGLPTCVPR